MTAIIIEYTLCISITFIISFTVGYLFNYSSRRKQTKKETYEDDLLNLIKELKELEDEEDKKIKMRQLKERSKIKSGVSFNQEIEPIEKEEEEVEFSSDKIVEEVKTQKEEPEALVEERSKEIEFSSDKIVEEVKTQKEEPKTLVEEKKKEIETSNDEIIEGVKPKLFRKARKGNPQDDLTQIKGVGQALENKLNELGVYYFFQIAEWNEANLNWLLENTTLAVRAKRDEWVKQARELVKNR